MLCERCYCSHVVCLCGVWCVLCAVCCVVCVCCMLCVCCVLCVVCVVCCVWAAPPLNRPNFALFLTPTKHVNCFCSLECLVAKLWCLEIWLIREAGTSHHECHGSRLRLVGTTSTRWPTPVLDSEMLWQMAEEFVGVEVLEVVERIRLGRIRGRHFQEGRVQSSRATHRRIDGAAHRTVSVCSFHSFWIRVCQTRHPSCQSTGWGHSVWC